MGLKSLRHALLMSAAAFGMSVGAAVVAQPAFAQEATRSYNIPAQDLGEALREFGRQSGRDVLFTPGSVAGKRSPGVRGQLTERDALRMLLNGTGLQFEQTASNGYAVRDSSSPTRASADDQASEQSDEEIVVTGTHIRGAASDFASVNTYGQEDIRQTGAGSISEFARRLPENLPSVDPSSITNAGGLTSFAQTNGNSFYGSTFNLRGLGEGSTLVMLNGTRVAPAGVSGTFVDITFIPLAAVQRIEVLPDGASAIYGADAVGGVVNIITQRDYSGAETAVRYGGATRGGGEELNASQLIGGTWDRASGIVVYEHGYRGGLDSNDRDFIPDQTQGTGLPRSISPQETRDQALASGLLELTPHADLSATAFYSTRETSTQSGRLRRGVPVATFSAAEVEQYGGSANLALELNDDWHLDIGGGTSRTNQVLEMRSSPAVIAPSTVHEDIASSSFDVLLNGTTINLPGGPVRLAVGASYRTEELQENAFGQTPTFDRTTSSVFGELYVPLIGEANQLPLARRLELSLAGRLDDYDDVGQTTNPKVGVLWEPLEGLLLRGSYSTSFRPPATRDLLQIPGYFVEALPDASAPDGETVTLEDFSQGNPNLRPETSTNYSFGIEFHPTSLPGFDASLSYFNIAYQDRITAPAVPGGTFFLFDNEAIVAPYIVRNPSPASVQAYFDTGAVDDFYGGGPGAVEAIFDDRITNIAATNTSGIDFSLRYGQETPGGRWDVYFSGVYMLENDFQNQPTTPSVTLLDSVFQPVNLRLRAGGTLTLSDSVFGLNLNYIDGYENNLFSPSQSVPSWTTADLTFQHTWDRAGIVLDFAVQNLTDEDPPHIASPFSFANPGYDAFNASALGRVVSLQLRKRW